MSGVLAGWTGSHLHNGSCCCLWLPPFAQLPVPPALLQLVHAVAHKQNNSCLESDCLLSLSLASILRSAKPASPLTLCSPSA